MEDISNVVTKELLLSTLQENKHLHEQVTSLQHQLGQQLDELRAETKARKELEAKLYAAAGAVKANLEFEVGKIKKQLAKIAYGGDDPTPRALDYVYPRLEEMARFWFQHHNLKEEGAS